VRIIAPLAPPECSEPQGGCVLGYRLRHPCSHPPPMLSSTRGLRRDTDSTTAPTCSTGAPEGRPERTGRERRVGSVSNQVRSGLRLRENAAYLRVPSTTTRCGLSHEEAGRIGRRRRALRLRYSRNVCSLAQEKALVAVKRMKRSRPENALRPLPSSERCPSLVGTDPHQPTSR
jgi:hypothetical protein